ncbi:MAG: hypothetical protein PHO08_06490 [Methylococcales bacterium]|nr:hypothetical protein [Methylococcales bacterium]MDD5633302.1 hypothetical protein [Methylococcales bacterium]
MHILPDTLLTEPEQSVKSNQTPYKVFTAFYNNASHNFVDLPQALPSQNFLSQPSYFTIDQLGLSIAESNPDVIQGGRNSALAILDKHNERADYLNTNDFPALGATSKLFAHLKFGTCSVREIYYAITEQPGSEHPLLRQLYWRDFFHPYRLSFSTGFQ